MSQRLLCVAARGWWLNWSVSASATAQDVRNGMKKMSSLADTDDGQTIYVELNYQISRRSAPKAFQGPVTTY